MTRSARSSAKQASSREVCGETEESVKKKVARLEDFEDRSKTGEDGEAKNKYLWKYLEP